MTAMRASFTLSLDDKLSAGLKGIQKEMDALRDTGKNLSLGKLERADDVLRNVSRQVRSLTSELQGVDRAAEGAWASLKRMASTSFQGIRGGLAQLRPSGRIGGSVGAIGGVVAGVSLIKPVQSYADFQNIALHSAITQGLSGQAAKAETNRLMAMFRKDALDSGQSSNAVGQAFQDLIQTGMTPDLAEKLLPIHSRAATAYNIAPEALGHAVFALADSFKIDESGMGGALASMAQASKEGRFKVEDFSHYLPQIGGNAAKLGMTGRGSADMMFAALETVMKNSADPSSGAANFTDFMNYLTSPHAAQTFGLHSRGMAPATKRMLEKYHVTGVDLPKLLENARIAGVDPITAVLGTLQSKTAGLPPEAKAEVLGAFFTNQQARDAALSLLQHPKDYLDLKERLSKVDAGILDRDFATAHDSAKTMLATGGEAGTQLEQRAGQGFEPIVRRLTDGLQILVEGIDKLDKQFPRLVDGVTLAAGSLLALASTLAALGFVAPAIRAGASLIGGGAAAGPVAAGVGIGSILKLGSDYETPENRALMEKNAQEARHQSGGPLMEPHDGSDIYGNWHGQEGKLDITIRTPPGTSATVNEASPGIKVKPLDTGSVTYQP